MIFKADTTISQHYSFQNKLKCIQVNLRHSKSASLALAQFILGLDVDIALIQEPFAYLGPVPVVANIPAGFESFHQLSADHAYGSSILVKKSIVKTRKVTTRHLSNHVACVYLMTATGPLRFAALSILGPP